MDVKKVLLGLGLSLVLSNGVAVAADLPKCTSGNWHNCVGQYSTLGFNSISFDGEFKNGVLNGQGTATYADGSEYVGEWRNGRMEGQGTLTSPDGTVQKGFWQNDVFFGTKDKWNIEEKKRITYQRIYNACLLDKSSDVDMQVSSLERAVKDTCKSIAKKPSWLENLRYD
jgi:hypothetical protein